MKQFSIVTVLLALVILPGAQKVTPLQQQQDQPNAVQQPAAPDQRGTEQQPLVVKTLKPDETAAESNREQADRAEKNYADLWMVCLTAALVGVGLLQFAVFVLQLFVFGKQAKRLRETIDKMDEVAAGQTADTARVIAESARSAVAMEGVAASMAENVENVKESVEISREIADRQKQITELQSRPFLAVTFLGVVPQDPKTGIRFEPRMTLINLGNTPAYNVKFCTSADVLPFPLPSDFAFPLPPPNRTSSFIAPRLTKILAAVVPKIYSVVEAKQITGGAGQRIFMWGYVTYDDAFGIGRFLRFGLGYYMLSDGNWMSTDTIQHNDAD